MSDHSRTFPPKPPRPLDPERRDIKSANQDGPSDEALLALSAAGDRGAFLRLHDRYGKRVYGLIVTVLGRGHEAEDAFQDAMWEIWRRAASYNPALGSPTTWILMLARSKAIDTARRRRRTSNLHAAVAENLQGTSHEGSGESTMANEPAQRERIEQATRLIARLPADQADVIRMAFMQGLTREEIAAALNIPVGTVKTRIRSGIQSIGGAMATLESAGEVRA